VTLAQAQQRAQEWKCVVVEASAKNNINISMPRQLALASPPSFSYLMPSLAGKIFEDMINEIEKSQNQNQTTTKEIECSLM